jgi:hypothetical protein
MYAVGILMRFYDNPGLAHWNAVKKVFAYLAGSKLYEMWYGEKVLELEGYSDADGAMGEDCKSISGYAFMINGGTVSWSSKKQPLVALSTTEAEYIAATHVAKEALWLRSLVSQVFGDVRDGLPLHVDNQLAIALAKDHQYHARMKHIDIRFHFICWIVDEGLVKLVYCPTEEMIADVLTKALLSMKVKHFAAALGLAQA